MKHCCERMRVEVERACDEQHTAGECSELLVRYQEKYDDYGLVVHDGGSSVVRIAFCPWCGTKLPESRRDRWFDELERRGINPQTDAVPAEFQTAAWYRGANRE